MEVSSLEEGLGPKFEDKQETCKESKKKRDGIREQLRKPMTAWLSALGSEAWLAHCTEE